MLLIALAGAASAGIVVALLKKQRAKRKRDALITALEIQRMEDEGGPPN